MNIVIGYDVLAQVDATLEDLRRAGPPRNAEALIIMVAERWPLVCRS
jgi:hypothetical protein